MKNKIVYPLIIMIIASLACIIIECFILFGTQYKTDMELFLNHNNYQWVTFFLSINPSCIGSIKFLMDPAFSTAGIPIIIHPIIIAVCTILLLRGKLKKTSKMIVNGIFILSCIISIITVFLYCCGIKEYFCPGDLFVYPNFIQQLLQYVWIYLLGIFFGLLIKIWIIIVILKSRENVVTD